ncbi:MAG: AI-2E family transporter [Bacteroidota bacterium]
MKREYSIALSLIGFVILGMMVWYFSNVVIYVIISAVLSFIGHPLVRLLDKISIGKIKLPHSLNAFLALITMILVFVGFFLFFVPLISNQANLISQINMQEIVEYFREPIVRVQGFLQDYDIIAADQTIQGMLDKQVNSMISLTAFSSIFGNLLDATSTFLMGLFTILFITFFFLKDESLLINFIVVLIPEKYEEKVRNAMSEIHRMLSRYFVGLLTELVTMMTLISVGLILFGVEGAIIIGFLGGLMNIIPYIGPIIGASMGVLLAVTTTLSMGYYDTVLVTSITVLLIFSVANLIDNIILQPIIYSTSVKAHPVEIFLVIIMAGTLAGIPGMILAIPGYTVLRVVAREFFDSFRLVRKLTDNM